MIVHAFQVLVYPGRLRWLLASRTDVLHCRSRHSFQQAVALWKGRYGKPSLVVRNRLIYRPCRAAAAIAQLKRGLDYRE